MSINDRIYGEIAITDPLIIDLINSKPMQRLKKITQDGATHYIVPAINVTRYEHSIGTWYLSFIYKRPIEEQVASLLHDVPHTAFSHVIDFVVGDENHEYHDRFIKEVIINSEIPEILKKHMIPLEKVLNKESYYLLDNKLPDISVDRLDYFLRDGYMFNLLPKQIVNLFLHAVKEKDERFYFTDQRTASSFAILFLTCSRLYWLGPNSHGSFFLLAQALKMALNKKYISEKDFYLTDEVLMDKLKNTQDQNITVFLDRLQPGSQFHYAPKEQAEFFGPNKPRFVDPWVLTDGRFTHVSDLIPGMKDYFEEFATRYRYLGVRQEGF